MSQVVKLQQGDSVPTTGKRLQFYVDNELVDVDERKLRDSYSDFHKSIGKKGRNKEDWDREFVELLGNIERGQSSGQYYRFQTAGDSAISANTNIDLTDAERGLDKKGRVRKPGMFSNITGVKNEAAINAGLVGFLGDSIAQLTRSSKELDAAKAKEDSDKLEAEKKQQSTDRYKQDFESLNLINSLYGPSIFTDSNASASNLKRFHLNPENQLGDLLTHTQRLQDRFSDYTDEDIAEFGKSHLKGINASNFVNTLRGVDLKDPNLTIDSLQGLYDSIGLGNQLTTLRDPDSLKALQSSAQAATATAKTDEVSNNAASTVEETPVSRVDLQNLAQSKRLNNDNTTITIDGAEVTLNDYLSNPENRTSDPDLYDQVFNARSATIRNFENSMTSLWQEVSKDEDKSLNTIKTPFINTPSDVSRFADVSNQYSGLATTGNRSTALVAEEIKGEDQFGEKQYRYKYFERSGLTPLEYEVEMAPHPANPNLTVIQRVDGQAFADGALYKSLGTKLDNAPKFTGDYTFKYSGFTPKTRPISKLPKYIDTHFRAPGKAPGMVGGIEPFITSILNDPIQSKIKDALNSIFKEGGKIEKVAKAQQGLSFPNLNIYKLPRFFNTNIPITPASSVSSQRNTIPYIKRISDQDVWMSDIANWHNDGSKNILRQYGPLGKSNPSQSLEGTSNEAGVLSAIENAPKPRARVTAKVPVQRVRPVMPNAPVTGGSTFAGLSPEVEAILASASNPTSAVTNSAPVADTVQSGAYSINQDAVTTPKQGVTKNRLNLDLPFSEVSEVGRLLYNINAIRSQDNRVEAPLLNHVQEIVPTVKGDHLLKNAYGNAANKLRSYAAQPFSSDAGVQLAGGLAANAKAADFELQGDVANAQSIAQQEALQTQALQEYARSRQEIGNTNIQTGARQRQAVRELENNQRLMTAQAIDRYWANQNQKSLINEERNRGIQDNINSLTFGEQEIMEGDFKGQTYQKAISSLQTRYDELQAKPNKTETEITELAKITGQMTQLSTDIKKKQLESQMRNNSIFSRKPVQGAVDINSLVTGFKKGGKMTQMDKISLEKIKSNQKIVKSWYDNYDKWTKESSGRFSRQNPSLRLVELALTPNKLK